MPGCSPIANSTMFSAFRTRLAIGSRRRALARMAGMPWSACCGRRCSGGWPDTRMSTTPSGYAMIRRCAGSPAGKRLQARGADKSDGTFRDALAHGHNAIRSFLIVGARLTSYDGDRDKPVCADLGNVHRQEFALHTSEVKVSIPVKKR
jgi:hypothetical protein